MSNEENRYNITFDKYLGSQCRHCGIEDYTMRYSCSRCDRLVCEKCQDQHKRRHEEYNDKLNASLEV